MQEDFSFTVNAVDTVEDFKRVKVKINEVVERFMPMMAAISPENRGVDVELIELDGDEADTLEFFGDEEEIFLGSVCWLVKFYASKKEGVRLSMKDKDLSHRYYVYADPKTGSVEFEGTANHVFSEILLHEESYYLDPKFHSYVLLNKGLPFNLDMSNLYHSKQPSNKEILLQKDRFCDLRRKKAKGGDIWIFEGKNHAACGVSRQDFFIALEIHHCFKQTVYEDEKFHGDDVRYYNEGMAMMSRQRKMLRETPRLMDEVVWSITHEKVEYVITVVEWLEMLKECEERLFPIMKNKFPRLLFWEKGA